VCMQTNHGCRLEGEGTNCAVILQRINIAKHIKSVPKWCKNR
jgi:hypothetical protein